MQNLTRVQRARQFVQTQARGFQTVGGRYASGFDRMVAEKLRWTRGAVGGGYLFALLGLLNAGGFMCSLMMDKHNFQDVFAYSGNNQLFKPFKSWCASDSLANVCWTSPSLILGGIYLQSKVGGLTSLKMFSIAMLACYGFNTAFGPHTQFGKLNLREYMPLRWDCIDEKKGSMVGADLPAGCVLYMCMAYHRYFMALAAFTVFDMAYYGPQAMCAPSSALFTAMASL